jgi:hypothetical protein
MNFYYPYGAVETYSGVSNVRSYWNDFFAYQWDAGVYPDSEDRFIKLLKLRIIRQKKAVYDQVGMPIVRFVINELRKLTGQPLLSDVPYGSWSADEVSTILELPSHGPGRIILDLPAWLSIESSLKTFLQQTPPYSGFYVYTWDPDTEQFMVWVPAKPLPSGSLYTFLTGDTLLKKEL